MALNSGSLSLLADRGAGGCVGVVIPRSQYLNLNLSGCVRVTDAFLLFPSHCWVLDRGKGEMCAASVAPAQPAVERESVKSKEPRGVDLHVRT